MRSLTDLNAMERRVLGALMEKHQTTPDNYPLSLNSLVLACNQLTNREPVMELSEMDVLNTLRVLLQDGWVERISGARVPRWSHLAEARLGANPARLSLITLLLLRGAQTGGELRGRSERLHSFDHVDEVLEKLRDFAEQDPPLVRMLPRQPGQKESRWVLIGQEIPETAGMPAIGHSPLPDDFQTQLDELRKRIERLEEELGIRSEKP